MFAAMELSEKKIVRIAILDLYEGLENQGMRCIRQIIDDWGTQHEYEVKRDEFEVRLQKQIPDASYDIYISSGGPGSPIDSIGSDWEQLYFNWLSNMEQWNNDPEQNSKKHVFFICHSFQLVARNYKIGKVKKRNSTAFGIFPIHM